MEWTDFDSRGLWVEGFDEYYVYKILESMGDKME